MITVLIGACVYLECRSATADTSILSRSITFEAGYDSDETKTWYIDTRLGFESGHWLYLAAQKNSVEPVDGIDLDSRSYFAGFGNDPEGEWRYDLEYENWGNPGDIETDALRAIVTLARGDWAFSLMPQYRHLDLAGLDNGDSLTFSERGLGAGLQYTGFGDWVLYLEHYEYDFSKNPNFLEDTGVTGNLTFTATSLASGLYDRETVLGVDYWLQPVNVSLMHIRDKPATDNGHIKTTELLVDYYFRDEIIPYLRIGRASFPGLSALWFGNIGVQFGW